MWSSERTHHFCRRQCHWQCTPCLTTYCDQRSKELIPADTCPFCRQELTRCWPTMDISSESAPQCACHFCPMRFENMCQLALHLIQVHPSATIPVNDPESNSDESVPGSTTPASPSSTIADPSLQNHVQLQPAVAPALWKCAVCDHSIPFEEGYVVQPMGALQHSFLCEVCDRLSM